MTPFPPRRPRGPPTPRPDPEALPAASPDHQHPLFDLEDNVIAIYLLGGLLGLALGMFLLMHVRNLNRGHH